MILQRLNERMHFEIAPLERKFAQLALPRRAVGREHRDTGDPLGLPKQIWCDSASVTTVLVTEGRTRPRGEGAPPGPHSMHIWRELAGFAPLYRHIGRLTIGYSNSNLILEVRR